MLRMLYSWEKRPASIIFCELFQHTLDVMKDRLELRAKGNSKFHMTSEDPLRALINFRIEEHSFDQNLQQTFKEDEFAKVHVAPMRGIGKSDFSVDTNDRGSNNSCLSFKPYRLRLRINYL